MRARSAYLYHAECGDPAWGDGGEVEFQNYIERLKVAFISEQYAGEIKKAKEEFIALGGELGNAVDGYEQELALFFDWYLFERPQSTGVFSPIELFCRSKSVSGEERKVYSDFTHQIHSLFVIKKTSPDIKVQDMFTRRKYMVNGNPAAMFEKGDVIETRLLLFRGGYRFSGAFCFYPQDIYKIIKAKAKEEKKKGIRDVAPLIHKFRKLKTIWSRCSNMDIKKVYTLMEAGLIT